MRCPIALCLGWPGRSGISLVIIGGCFSYEACALQGLLAFFQSSVYFTCMSDVEGLHYLSMHAFACQRSHLECLILKLERPLEAFADRRLRPRAGTGKTGVRDPLGEAVKSCRVKERVESQCCDVESSRDERVHGGDLILGKLMGHVWK